MTTNTEPATILEEALSRVVGYHDGSADYDQLEALETSLRNLGTERTSLAAQQRYNDLLATSTDGAEVLNARTESRATAEANISAHEALKEIEARRATLRRSARDYRTDDVAPGLAWLHSQLKHLMRHVKDLDKQLAGIRTSDDALRAPDTQRIAYQQLDAAVQTYEQLRAAQHQLTWRTAYTGSTPSTNEHDARKAHILLANAFDVEEHFRALRSATPSSGWPGTGGAAATWRAWLGNIAKPTSSVVVSGNASTQTQAGNAWHNDSNRHDELRSLARTGNAWIPTHDQLETAARAAQQMLAPVNNLDTLRQALAAHDTYYGARGVEPTESIDVADISAALPRPRRGGRRVGEPVQTDPRLLRY